MDKKIANNVLVGVIFSLGFVAFTFLIFSIGGGSGFLSRTYKLYGRFKHVKGLHTGSEISLSGLRIGVISKISLAENNTKELKVELTINKNVQERIRQDSIASIRTQGVLGDKYIEISIGSSDQPVLKSGDEITSLESEDLFTKSGNLVDEISKQFSGGDFESLIRNLNTVARNLAQLTQDLRTAQTAIKLGKASGHLEGILKKIDTGEGTIGALINDPTVYEDIKSLMGGAKRSTILQYFMRQFIDTGRKSENQAPQPKK